MLSMFISNNNKISNKFLLDWEPVTLYNDLHLYFALIMAFQAWFAFLKASMKSIRV